MRAIRILLFAGAAALAAVAPARAGDPPPAATPTSLRVPAARLLDPVSAGPSADYAGIERARRADPRFARLTLDLRDGRVVIGGSAPDPAAAWDLAHRVAPLAGGRDVVVGRVGR